MGHDIIDILNRVKVALLFWKTPFKMHHQSLLNKPVCAFLRTETEIDLFYLFSFKNN